MRKILALVFSVFVWSIQAQTVTWKNVQGLSPSSINNSLTKTASTSYTNSFASTENALIGDFEITWTTVNETDKYIVGLSEENHTYGGNYWETMDFCVEQYSSLFYTEGNLIAESDEEYTGFDAGEVASIKRVGNILTFKIGDFVLGTEYYSGAELFLELNIYNNGISNPPLTITGGDGIISVSLELVEIQNTAPGTSDGSIEILVKDGDNPVIDWDNDQYDGLTMLSDLSPGSYTVTITDQSIPSPIIQTYTVKSVEPIVWHTDYLVGLQDNGDNSLTKTAGYGSTNSWASSRNALQGDGSISWEIKDLSDYYVIGLSKQHHSVGGYDNQMEFTFEQVGSTIYVEGTETSYDYTSLSIGDLIEIKRENNQISFWVDGFELSNSISVDPSDRLHIEAGIKYQNESIPQITTTFGVPLSIDPEITNTEEGFSNGSIVLNVFGGDSPVYDWSDDQFDGLTELTNLSAGIYSVTITDPSLQSSIIETFTVLSLKPIEWYSLDGFNDNGDNTLTKTAGYGSSNSWASSKNALIGNGYISWIVKEESELYIIGLSDHHNTAGSYSYGMDYAIEQYYSDMDLEGSLLGYGSTDAIVGEEVKIERKDGEMIFWVGGFELGSRVSVDNNKPLYIEVSARNSGYTIPQITTSFGIPLSVELLATNPTCDNNDGSITVQVDGGKIDPSKEFSYDFLWSNGYTGKDIDRLIAGDYTLTVTDANGETNVSTVTLSGTGAIEWNEESALGISVNGTSITKTAPDGLVAGGASNIVSLNEFSGDGSIKFTIKNTTDSYIIGLSNEDHGNTDTDGFKNVDYGVRVSSSIFKSTWRNPSTHQIDGSYHYDYLASLEVGTEIEIRKTGNTISWLVDGIDMFVDEDIITDGFTEEESFLTEASIQNQGGSITVDEMDGCYNPLKLEPRITHLNLSDGQLGNILLDISGGEYPYSLSWSTGAQDNDQYVLSDLNEGSYTVTVTDNAGSQMIETFEVGHEFTFGQIQNVQFESGILSKTTQTDSWDAGAIADQKLEAYVSGGFATKVKDLNNGEYAFGFSSPTNLNYALADLEYAFVVKGDHADVLSKGQILGTYSLAKDDRLEVKRNTEGKIEWYINADKKHEVDELLENTLASKALLREETAELTDIVRTWTELQCLDYVAYEDQGLSNNYNWVHSKSYGDDCLINEKIVYTDEFGRTLQTLTKNNVKDLVVANQVVYDKYGRAVIQTLPAPIQGTSFAFDDNFSSSNINLYDGSQLTGELGQYYSTANNSELYVAADKVPYSRTIYNDQNSAAIAKSTIPGEALMKGSGKEMMEVSMPGIGEMNYMFGLYSEDCSETFYDNYADNIGIIDCSPEYTIVANGITKTVLRDGNGQESVVFYDKNGNTIATALSGQVDGEDVQSQKVGHRIDSRANNKDYYSFIDIHIPQRSQPTRVTIKNPNDNAYLSLSYSIINLETNQEVAAQNINTNNNVYEDLPSGFYRVYNKSTSGNYSKDLLISYSTNYHNFALSYYDKLGRQVKTVSPNDVDYSFNPTKVNYKVYTQRRDLENAHRTSHDALEFPIDAPANGEQVVSVYINPTSYRRMRDYLDEAIDVINLIEDTEEEYEEVKDGVDDLKDKWETLLEEEKAKALDKIKAAIETAQKHLESEEKLIAELEKIKEKNVLLYRNLSTINLTEANLALAQIQEMNESFGNNLLSHRNNTTIKMLADLQSELSKYNAEGIEELNTTQKLSALTVDLFNLEASLIKEQGNVANTRKALEFDRNELEVNQLTVQNDLQHIIDNQSSISLAEAMVKAMETKEALVKLKARLAKNEAILNATIDLSQQEEAFLNLDARYNYVDLTSQDVSDLINQEIEAVDLLLDRLQDNLSEDLESLDQLVFKGTEIGNLALALRDDWTTLNLDDKNLRLAEIDNHFNDLNNQLSVYEGTPFYSPISVEFKQWKEFYLGDWTSMTVLDVQDVLWNVSYDLTLLLVDVITYQTEINNSGHPYYFTVESIKLNLQEILAALPTVLNKENVDVVIADIENVQLDIDELYESLPSQESSIDNLKDVNGVLLNQLNVFNNHTPVNLSEVISLANSDKQAVNDQINNALSIVNSSIASYQTLESEVDVISLDISNYVELTNSSLSDLEAIMSVVGSKVDAFVSTIQNQSGINQESVQTILSQKNAIDNSLTTPILSSVDREALINSETSALQQLQATVSDLTTAEIISALTHTKESTESLGNRRDKVDNHSSLLLDTDGNMEVFISNHQEDLVEDISTIANIGGDSGNLLGHGYSRDWITNYYRLEYEVKVLNTSNQVIGTKTIGFKANREGTRWKFTDMENTPFRYHRDAQIGNGRYNVEPYYIDRNLNTDIAKVVIEPKAGSAYISYIYIDEFDPNDVRYYHTRQDIEELSSLSWLSDDDKIRNMEQINLDLKEISVMFRVERQRLDDLPNHTISEEFVYDRKGNLALTKSAEKGTTYFLYDAAGKLRFSQNAIQREFGDRKYNYINYDKKGRVIEKGVYNYDAPSGAVSSNDYWFVQGINAGLSAQSDAYNFIPTKRLEHHNHLAYSYNDINTYDVLNSYDGLDDARCSEQLFLRYDQEDPNFPATYASQLTQSYLHGKLSKKWNDESAVWYGYDSYGRVDWELLQNTLGYKTIHYKYNYHGSILEVIYQKGETDEFHTHYTYNANNELQKVETSLDGVSKMEHAEYTYYPHGPLQREELGVDLQGLDYTYTIQGWLKAVNSPTIESLKDPGKDGFATSNFQEDIFGYALEYFEGDYTPSGGISFTGGLSTGEYPSQYNGNIRNVHWNNREYGTAGQHYSYSYDYNQSGYMRNAQYFNQGNSQTSDYFVGNIQYDRNGNITHLERNASGSNLQMDVLDYHYNSTKNNQLDYVSDAVSNTAVSTYDVDNQSAGNYVYDDLGQLKDDVEGGKYMDYNSYGLITKVYSDASRTTPIMENVYDVNGFRMSKITYDIVNSGIASKTHYVRSSSGSLLGVYEELYSGGASQGIEFSEVPIVGNSRIGTYQIPINRVVYELNDHTGNVRAVVTRDLNNNSPEVLSYSDYYPFGMKMPGRSLNRNDYRYGYQGQFTEHDTETDWDYFEARNYDSKLARWMSPDPVRNFHTSYAGMFNNPISQVDPDGRDPILTAVLIGMAVNGISSYISNKRQGIEGAELFGKTVSGAVIGGLSAPLGGAVAIGVGKAIPIAIGGLLATASGGMVSSSFVAFNSAVISNLDKEEIARATYIAGGSAFLGSATGAYIGGGIGAFTGGAISSGISSSLKNESTNNILINSVVGGAMSLATYSLQQNLAYQSYKSGTGGVKFANKLLTKEQFMKMSVASQRSFARGKEFGGWILDNGKMSMWTERYKSAIQPSKRPSNAIAEFHTHPNLGKYWRPEHSKEDMLYAEIVSYVLERNSVYSYTPGQVKPVRLGNISFFNPYISYFQNPF